MKLSVRKGEASVQSCDVLLLGMFQGEKELLGDVFAINTMLDGLLKKVMTEEGFKGQLGQTVMLRTDGLLAAKRVELVGLGKKDEWTLETLREVTALALQALHDMRTKQIVSTLPGCCDVSWNVKEVSQAMTEAVRLACYTYDRYKKQKRQKVLSYDLLMSDGRAILQAKRGIKLGELSARATMYARDLVNTPAHHLCPIDLVHAAKAIQKIQRGIHVRVFDRDRLEKIGAGGILGVAQGSDHPPYLVHMIYKPRNKTKHSVALVGKAVTFDSGGLSLKPADYMTNMKNDMSGAAVVLGVFSVIAELAPTMEVHGIFAPVENMPSGKAIRPGDVLRAMNKKTVEVLNTDAEGRLTLMDMLVYAQKFKPNSLIDLATLTGACVVALGEEVTGVMSNHPKLAQKILSAATEAGEKMWELPLEKNYTKLLKSSIADLQNIGGRYGGALTAGLFLKEFVDSKTPWAHLDIAGPAFAERDINAYTKKGATGHGVRTMLRFLLT